MLAIFSSAQFQASSNVFSYYTSVQYKRADVSPANPDLELSSAAKNKLESLEFSSPIKPRALKSDSSVWIKPLTSELLITLILVNLVIKSVNPKQLKQLPPIFLVLFHGFLLTQLPPMLVEVQRYKGLLVGFLYLPPLTAWP